MYTRFYMDVNSELQEIAEEAKAKALTEQITAVLSKPLRTSGEIHPTDLVPAIASTPKGTRGVYPMVFGFYEPNIDHPLLNARIETAASKQLWKECLAKRRCVIPASYYFEWQHLIKSDGRKVTGDKYMMQPFGATMTWLAGIYRIEEFRGLKYPAFVILTRKPGPDLMKIHDRMPVVLPKEDVNLWIRPDTDPTLLLDHAITDLIIERA